MNENIKCPVCGSTAQVKRVNEVVLTVDKRIIKVHYECGCGCKFRNEYAYRGTYKDEKIFQKPLDKRR